jgi:putative inorganic carbon (hco3(-)) transporter
MTAARAAVLRFGPPVQRGFGVLGMAAALGAAALAGAALMVIASTGKDAAPLVALAVPILPLLAVAVLWRPSIGVIAVLATIPFGSVAIPTGAVRLEAIEIAVLVVGALVVLRRLALGQTPFPWSPLFAFPLALVACTLIALYSALDPALAAKQFGALIGGAVFAATVMSSCRDMEDVRRVVGVLVLVVSVVAVVALSTGGGRLESSYGGATVSGRLEGAFSSPNQLGALVAVGAVLAVGVAVGARMGRSRVFGGLALALLLAVLALSLSRGAWIGAALAFGFLIVTLKEARRMLFAFAVPLVVIGFFVWSAEPDRPELKVVGERAKAFTARSPYDGRDQIWAEAIREIKNDPLTGQGPGNFPVASVRAGSEASSVSPDHAHNLFLNWAAETGIPAVVIIIFFIVALGEATRRAGRAARERGDPRDRAIVLAIAAALIAVLGQGLFDYVLTNAVLHITTWGLIGLLIVCRREAVAPGAIARRRDGYRPVR